MKNLLVFRKLEYFIEKNAFKVNLCKKNVQEKQFFSLCELQFKLYFKKKLADIILNRIQRVKR